MDVLPCRDVGFRESLGKLFECRTGYVTVDLECKGAQKLQISFSEVLGCQNNLVKRCTLL